MSQSPNEVTATDAGTVDLSTSDRYEVLAAERRRVTLDILAERATPVDLENLATAVTEREADAERDDGETVEQVAISLHHNHLPKMADFGAIDYDPEATRVESCSFRPDT
ncbi:hypothetical protein QA599_17935 [Haloarculaceae archaeon H-GB1-1]|nr:hypothetical protein [Haloarculaceae archaeon H-GB1-1]